MGQNTVGSYRRRGNAGGIQLQRDSRKGILFQEKGMYDTRYLNPGFITGMVVM